MVLKLINVHQDIVYAHYFYFLFQDSEAYCYLLEQIAPRENGVMSGPPLSVSLD